MSYHKGLVRSVSIVVGLLWLGGACFEPMPLWCGVDESCPHGYVCDRGLCVEDQADGCQLAFRGYDYKAGDCLQGAASGCHDPFMYRTLSECCAAQPDAPACLSPCADHGDCDSTALCEQGQCVPNGDCATSFDGYYHDSAGDCVLGQKSGCDNPFYDSLAACEAVVTQCPADPPLTSTVTAAIDLTCEYGQECCCGKCYPNYICTAPQGDVFGCFNSDACLVQMCDQCSGDADCAQGQVCTPGPDGTSVCADGCRADAGCGRDEQCVQVECVTLPCPPRCVAQQQSARARLGR